MTETLTLSCTKDMRDFWLDAPLIDVAHVLKSIAISGGIKGSHQGQTSAHRLFVTTQLHYRSDWTKTLHRLQSSEVFHNLVKNLAWAAIYNELNHLAHFPGHFKMQVPGLTTPITLWPFESGAIDWDAQRLRAAQTLEYMSKSDLAAHCVEKYLELHPSVRYNLLRSQDMATLVIKVLCDTNLYDQVSRQLKAVLVKPPLKKLSLSLG
jgi:hypothetical protein